MLLIIRDIKEMVFMATELVPLSSGPSRVLGRLPLNFARHLVTGESSHSIRSDPQFIAVREYVLSRVLEQRKAFSRVYSLMKNHIRIGRNDADRSRIK